LTTPEAPLKKIKNHDSELVAPRTLSRGDKIRVRHHESEQWTHAYFDHYDKRDGVCVIEGGRSPYTQVNECNQQRHELTEHDIEWGNDRFETVTYHQYERPLVQDPIGAIKDHEHYVQVLNSATENGLIVLDAGAVHLDTLKRGDLVQVKQHEDAPWINAYLDRFWTDGRIQVLPYGRSPWTEIDGEYKQHHQSSAEHRKKYRLMFPHATFNFYRLPQEITDSGDLRDGTAYLEHWGSKIEPPLLDKERSQK